MAGLLGMDCRSYVDLDHGKSACSGLTLAMYLSNCCLDPLGFLQNFRKEIGCGLVGKMPVDTVLDEAITYRAPLLVAEVYRYQNGDTYPVCPRCNRCLDREYVQYCDRCGQRLDWRKINNVAVTNYT